MPSLAKSPIAAVALALPLAACTPGTQGYIRNMESHGHLRVEPAYSSDYDYNVHVRNVLDIGYDPSDKATRDRTALQMLENQCPTGSVVGETVINTGEWMGGRPSETYILHIRCT